MRYMNVLVASVLLCISTIGLAETTSLMVAPSRVVFDERTKAAELSLVNNGVSASTYRVSLVHLRMLADGRMEEVPVEDPSAPWADFIRYSPKAITLEPKAVQSVRVQVRTPANLPDGEYRTHLMFKLVPKDLELDTKTAKDGAEIVINIAYGISVPVIVRHHTQPATAGVSCSITEGKDALDCKLSREGTQSIYGRLVARYKGLQIGNVAGVACYVPMPYRTIVLPLVLPPDVSLSSGSIDVDYVEPASGGVLASTTVRVP